ncbi:hypothetical protein [Paenibacillus sp. 1P07SE]|uniref:hypothetical protein n=1 Tax=Paenibacillus sp. 1P07SE TaxID=3132209 RepID=UPI0039A52A34
MADNVHEEQPVKRSWFTGVVVVLLVASMTFNMYLYSQKLHSNQRERTLAGERIILAAWDAQLYTETVLDNIRRLLESSAPGERIAAKQALGYAFGGSAKGVHAFISAAQEQEPREGVEMNRSALHFLSQVELSLRSIGNHGEQLTEPERAYLTLMEELYVRLLEEISTFDVTNATQQESLLMFVETEWVDMAYAMLSIMNEPDNLIVEGVDEAEAAVAAEGEPEA